MKHRCRHREAADLAGVPEKLPGLRVVGVDPFGRVDDHLAAERAVDDERRAVGGTALAAICLPPILAGLLVDGEEVRARGLIAKEDELVAVKDGRAPMAPLDVEGAVLCRKVALPDHGTAAIERDDLAGAEPGIDQCPVGDRARRREVVLVVHGC